MKKIITTIFIVSALASCTKTINVDLNTADPQLVVEGTITDDVNSNQVRITKTVNFSETNNFPAVTGAIVTISDDVGNTDTLNEVSPGLYKPSTLIGVSGRTYNLKIITEGKTITAQSKMPNKVNLDTLDYIEQVFGPASGSDKNYSVIPRFKDPVGRGNSYRFIQSTTKLGLDKSLIIANDNTLDGKVNQRPILNRDYDIKIGDTVTIEMQNIDEHVYLYLNALNNIAGNGPGGGTTPANPPTNLVGTPLGFFSAHTIQHKTIVIK